MKKLNFLYCSSLLLLWLVTMVFFKKWAKPGLFFIYFCLFKHTLQFLQQINVIKCPSSIWCWDSNTRPLKHESPPITNRPGRSNLISIDGIQNAKYLCQNLLCQLRPAKRRTQKLERKISFSTFFFVSQKNCDFCGARSIGRLCSIDDWWMN